MFKTKNMIAGVLVLAVGATGALTGTAGAKKKKLRPPTCEQTIALIQITANRKAAELANQGFTPDEYLGHNYSYGDTCRLIRPNKRRGTGRITDFLPYGSDPDYEGQPFYVWTWSQTVARTAKGTFISYIGDVTCLYGVQTGTGIGGARYC